MRRRTEILNAAELVATEEGWDELTVVSVARRARLSRALVYLNFSHRDDLLLGIRDRAIETLCRQMADAAATDSTGQAKLQAVMRAAEEFADTQRVYFESLLRTEILSLERGPKSTGDFLGSKGEPCRRVLARVIAIGLGDGSIRRDVGEPKVVAAILWRFVYGLLQLGAGKDAASNGRLRPLHSLFGQAVAMIGYSVTGSRASRPDTLVTTA